MRGSETVRRYLEGRAYSEPELQAAIARFVARWREWVKQGRGKGT